MAAPWERYQQLTLSGTLSPSHSFGVPCPLSLLLPLLFRLQIHCLQPCLLRLSGRDAAALHLAAGGCSSHHRTDPWRGGQYTPALAPFLAALRSLCDEHGILLIFDEVQSGMGRSGDWFATQSYGISPDILTLAKGIASGFPLSAVVSRSELMDQWPTWAHGTTFGGNPLSCAEP